MNIIRPHDLNTLTEKAQHPCISIFIGTHVAGKDTREDKIRLKNMARKAQKELQDASIKQQQIEKLLDPVHELIETHEFWLHQSHGLAVFLCPGHFVYYRLPISFEDKLTVANRFHLKPIMPMFSVDGRFYILEFNQHQVRLHEATRYNIHELSLPDQVREIDQILQFDQLQKLTFGYTARPSGTPAAGQGRVRLYHGQGYEGDPNKHKKDIHRFAQELDNVICKKLAHQQAPLLLAGVEYVRAIYHENNHYPNLLEQGIDGNTEQMGPEQLHEQGWNIARGVLAGYLQRELDVYQSLAGTGQTSYDVAAIVPAAAQGKIRSLFVDTNQSLWGTFDTQTLSVQPSEQQQPGDLDLMDLAIIKALDTGASIYALAPEQMPEEKAITATFRY